MSLQVPPIAQSSHRICTLEFGIEPNSPTHQHQTLQIGPIGTPYNLQRITIVPNATINPTDRFDTLLSYKRADPWKPNPDGASIFNRPTPTTNATLTTNSHGIKLPTAIFTFDLHPQVVNTFLSIGTGEALGGYDSVQATGNAGSYITVHAWSTLANANAPSFTAILYYGEYYTPRPTSPAMYPQV